MLNEISGKPCTEGTHGVTMEEVRMIIICPSAFTTYLPLVDDRQNTDVSGRGLTIDTNRPLSVVILHEFLHLVFPLFSKSTHYNDFSISTYIGLST